MGLFPNNQHAVVKTAVGTEESHLMTRRIRGVKGSLFHDNKNFHFASKDRMWLWDFNKMGRSLHPLDSQRGERREESRPGPDHCLEVWGCSFFWQGLAAAPGLWTWYKQQHEWCLLASWSRQPQCTARHMTYSTIYPMHPYIKAAWTVHTSQQYTQVSWLQWLLSPSRQTGIGQSPPNGFAAEKLGVSGLLQHAK